MKKRRVILTVGGIAIALVAIACLLAVLLVVPKGGTVSSDVDSAAHNLAPSAPGYADDSAREEGSGSDFGAGLASAEAQDQTERMIIWNATVELTLADTTKALSGVQALAHELGGYTIGSESWQEDQQVFGRVTIRVPAEKFETALSRLREMAVSVDRESATSDDVTDEYVDLESQLRALQAKEAQLEKLMAEAEDTEAVLAVYDHLSATQVEIEQIKGRMAYLEKLSALATITVELRPEAAARPVVVEGWRPSATVRNAARVLVDALQGLGDVVIWFVVFLLPILLLLAVPVVVIILVIRAVRRRRASKRAAA